MSLYISIKKINKRDDIYYYKIETDDFGDQFKGAYVGIDPASQQISFFDENLKVLKTINIQKEDELDYIAGMPRMLFAHVFVKCIKALKRNEFPDSLDYCA